MTGKVGEGLGESRAERGVWGRERATRRGDPKDASSTGTGSRAPEGTVAPTL